jgi:hypothetical protein
MGSGGGFRVAGCGREQGFLRHLRGDLRVQRVLQRQGGLPGRRGVSSTSARRSTSSTSSTTCARGSTRATRGSGQEILRVQRDPQQVFGEVDKVRFSRFLSRAVPRAVFQVMTCRLLIFSTLIYKTNFGFWEIYN